MTASCAVANEYSVADSEANAPNLADWACSRSRNNQTKPSSRLEASLALNSSWRKFEQNC